MTRRAKVLNEIEPTAEVHVSPVNSRIIGVKAGDKVKVITRRGEIDLAVRIDPALQDDLIFIPFCFNAPPSFETFASSFL